MESNGIVFVTRRGGIVIRRGFRSVAAAGGFSLFLALGLSGASVGALSPREHASAAEYARTQSSRSAGPDSDMRAELEAAAAAAKTAGAATQPMRDALAASIAAGAHERRPAPAATAPDEEWRQWLDKDYPINGWRAEEAARYWTPARLAKAAPVRSAHGAEGTSAPGDRISAGSEQFDGYPVVGQIVATVQGDRFCSASVVSSPGKNLLVTAAHCLTGETHKALAFIPQSRAGQQPFGLFAVKPGRIWFDQRYLNLGNEKAARWDVAFLELESQGGRNVEDVVGGLRMSTDAGFDHPAVHLVGYPGDKPRPSRCTSATTKFSSPGPWPGDFLKISCDGFSPGTSGGPFINNFNGSTGDVIGVIGGFHDGGPNDNESYSSYFGADARTLYDTAVNGSAPSPPTGGLPPSWMWRQHERGIAPGNFAAGSKIDSKFSDLVVRWEDGEVSLHHAAGDARFDTEYTLAAPNDLWKNATSIAAGKFAGRTTDDLLVRWADGELTLYPGVDQSGFHGEIQLMPPNDLWKNAVSIVGGRFSVADTRRNDLIVRWVDGELTLYPDLDQTGFHGEKQLAAPNELWKNTRAITSGDFTGNDAWDLMVRWVDGEVTVCPDIDDAGFHGEHRVQPPNTLWTNAITLAAGNYDGNGHPDDLLVRWIDGEVNMYVDSGTQLGRERILVVPK